MDILVEGKRLARYEISMDWNDQRLYVPDGTPAPEALSRLTHLGIGAHQDDLEFHALHGILECWDREDQWFGGITCTDGAGSSRTGPFANYSDEQMRAVRVEEQNSAARIGRYGAMIQLGYPSSQVRNPSDPALRNELRELLDLAQPEIVYTHALADKHETHIGVVMNVIAAIRELPADRRPARLLGFEGWRDLDWLPGEHKIRLNVSAHPELARELSGVFQSQIAGGKRYDLAIDGRRAANATLDDPYGPDGEVRVTCAMEMTPLIEDDSLDPLEFTLRLVEKFAADIRKKVSPFC